MIRRRRCTCPDGRPPADIEPSPYTAWRVASVSLGEAFTGDLVGSAIGDRDRRALTRLARRAVRLGEPVRVLDVLAAAGLTPSLSVRVAAAEACEAAALVGVYEAARAACVARCARHGGSVREVIPSTA